MNLFKKSLEKAVSVNDLQEEIKNLKKEVQSLKTRDDDLKLKILEL